VTYTRCWAVTLMAATAGGFLAVDQYAFATDHAVWIAFGAAIAAGVCCLAGTIDAFVRQNQPLSGLSTVGALIAPLTVIATRAFTAPTALWLAFAGGLALLLVSLRALALHEATVERVVYSLELNGSGHPVAVRASQRGRYAVRAAPRRARDLRKGALVGGLARVHGRRACRHVPRAHHVCLATATGG
jgi:hypothetical protein